MHEVKHQSANSTVLIKDGGRFLDIFYFHWHRRPFGLEAACLRWFHSGFVAGDRGEGAKEHRYSWPYLYMLTKPGPQRSSEQQRLLAWSFKGRSKLRSSLLPIAVLRRQRCCNWWEGEMAKSLARLQPALSPVKDKEFPQPGGFLKCQARVSY